LEPSLSIRNINEAISCEHKLEEENLGESWLWHHQVADSPLQEVLHSYIES